MARIKVADGETVTTETIVALGDALLVAAGGTIARTGVVPAVSVTGADASIRNAGEISVTGATGAAITGALSGTLDVSLINTGTIRGDSGAISLSSVDGTTGDVRISNAGTIDGGLSQAIAMRDLRASSITIVNQDGGLIINAGTADVVRPGHDLATAIRVVNAGDIIAGTVVGASSSGDGIDFQAQDGGVLGTVINRGTGLIEGGKHAITGANAAFILNEVGGQIIGRNGSGINFDTEQADGDGAVRVINHGLISGQYDGFGDGDGDGVDVDYLVEVRNDGRIEGIGADDIDDFADGIAAGGGRIVNLAGGEIFGDGNGILIDDGDRNGAYAETRIVNAGTIGANDGYGVRLIGDFNDTIVNSGTIAGFLGAAIDAGGGDDRVVNHGSIFGLINLGDGEDQYLGQDGAGLSFDGNIVDGGAGDDRILAGAFEDTLIGGLGADILSGGAGDDTFFYTTPEDSGISLETADRIVDFTLGDTIDLSAIDADTTVDGNQAFTYGGLSGPAGILQSFTTGDLTIVGGDVDGDANADFFILLQGVSDPSVLAFNL